MDPVSAFSLTCGVIQIVDFSTKAVSSCRRLYKAGSLSENAEVEEWTNHLIRLRDELYPPASRGNVADASHPDEQELLQLAVKCSDTASDLVAELNTLRLSSPRRKREAVKKGFQALWKKSTLDEIQKRLTDYQRLLDSKILIYVRRLLIENSSKQAQGFRELDVRYQAIADSLRQGEKKFTELKDLIQDEHAATRQHISKELRSHHEAATEEKHYQRILESLHFPEIYCRQEEIADAHAETFQWIFDASPGATRPWNSFVQWLESGQGTYWISGKMGSGKSTLMSYICQDHRTRAALSRWGGAGVITPSFFFWSPGSQLQKSIVGLLRSLIYQILKERPDLAPLVAQDGPLETWTERRLRDILRRLMQESSIHRPRSCFFIDGLDEFAEDQSSLIDLVRSLTHEPDVKVCLSSRPYKIFRQAFGSSSMLRLQDLTESDIQIYVFENLLSLPQVQSLSSREQQSVSIISQKIVERAQGVFLWVSLAVKDQKEGLRNEDDVEILESRLRTLPTEIEDVYAHLLSRVGKIYKAEAADMIYIALHGDSGLSILDVALLLYRQLDEFLHSSSDTCVPLFDCQKIERRLLTTCFGFLEVNHAEKEYLEGPLNLSEQQMELFRSGHAFVGFLHRSAADFFRDNEQGKRFLDDNHNADRLAPSLIYIKPQIAKVRLLGFPLSGTRLPERDIGGSQWRPRYLDRDILRHLRDAQAEIGPPLTLLCSALDRAMTILDWQSEGSRQSTHWTLRAKKWFHPYGDFILVFDESNQEPDVAINLSTTPDNSNLSSVDDPAGPLTTPRDFLGLAALFGLDLYVESIIASRILLTVSYANYLLSCALRIDIASRITKYNYVTTNYSRANLRIVSLLLHLDVINPNEAALNCTFWTFFLRQMYELRLQLLSPVSDRFEDASWATAAKDFLDRGATLYKQIIFKNLWSNHHDSFDVSYLTDVTNEARRETGSLESVSLDIQLSVSSCLSHCLPDAPWLATIQEECAEEATGFFPEIVAIKFDIGSKSESRKSRKYRISKAQSDQLLPIFKKSMMATEEPDWSTELDLGRAFQALYVQLFEEEEAQYRSPAIQEKMIRSS